MSVSRTLDAEDEGTTLAAAVRRTMDGLSWNQARRLCRSGRVRIAGKTGLDPAARVRAGAHLRIDPDAPPRPREGRRALAPEAIVHADHELVVVNKPAGLLSVPFSPDDRDTLLHRVRTTLRRVEGRSAPPLRVVQRLDKDTSGLLVFARTRRAERALQAQLRRHEMQRRYLALALGRVAPARHESDLVRNRGDGLRGSWRGRGRAGRPNDAKRAITEVERLDVFAVPPECSTRRPAGDVLWVSLVACRLHTGRQHQIRIHLAESGHPLVGEAVYVRDYTGPFVRDHEPGRARPMLHAQQLGFVHPASDRSMLFERPPPDDFQALLDRLHAGAGQR